MSKKSTIGRFLLRRTVPALVSGLDRLAPGLAADWGATLFLRTRRFPPPAREREIALLGEQVSFETPLGALRAWSWGHGPTVLLVHGWEGRGSQLGAFVRPLLAEGFSVLAFDAPGHGGSPGRSSSLAAMGESLLAVAEEVESVFAVVAHSAGAVAATWAFRRGLAVERAAFVAPGSRPAAYVELAARRLGLGAGGAGRLRARIEARVGVGLADLDPLSSAPRLTVPLLVVHDRGDREAPLEGAAELVRAWPGAALVVTDGLGHRRVLWDRGVVERVVGFVVGPSRRVEQDPASTVA